MDLEDLYSDLDDEELGALFRIGGSVKASTRSKPSARGKVRISKGARTGGGGIFGIGTALRGVSQTAARARKAAMLAARRAKKRRKPSRSRKRIVRGMMKRPKRRKVYKLKRRPMRRIKRKSILPMKRRLPISTTCPAAYRQLACNAGLGGTAGTVLLKQIRDMVQLSNTRQLATSEHNRINKTHAFRRAVLEALRKKRCR